MNSNKLNKDHLSKTKSIQYINNQSIQDRKKSWWNQGHDCHSCELEKNIKQEDSYKNLEEFNRNRVLQNTFHYLEKYLNPDIGWNKEITPKQRINQIRYADVNWGAVADHIKSMDYQNFLKTPYWKAISAHTKYKAGYRCQLCNSPYKLIAHHRSYNIHGFEHAHMQELIILCNNCHNKFHGNKKKTQFSKRKSKMIKRILIILSILFISWWASTLK